MINCYLVCHSSWKFDVGLAHWTSKRRDFGVGEKLTSICIVVRSALNNWIFMPLFGIWKSIVGLLIVSRGAIILFISTLIDLRVVIGVLQRLLVFKIWGGDWLDLRAHHFIVLSLLLIHHEYFLIHILRWMYNIDWIWSSVGTKVLIYPHRLVAVIVLLISSTLLGWRYDIW